MINKKKEEPLQSGYLYSAVDKRCSLSKIRYFLALDLLNT